MLLVLARHGARFGIHQRLCRARWGFQLGTACQRLMPCRLEPRRHQRLALARRIGAGCGRGRFELDQHLAGTDGLPIRHEDALDDAHLGRLDQLGSVRRDDLARRDRHEIDLADARPADGEAKRRDDRPEHRARQRRRRRLDELERRGQEFAFERGSHACMACRRA